MVVTMAASPVAASLSASTATLGAGSALSDTEQVDTASVTFNNQASDGSTVVVDRAVLPSGGHITIHDIGGHEDAGKVVTKADFGEALGSTSYLGPGQVHETVRVTLDEPVPEDEALIAVVYRSGSSGDLQDADTPYIDEIGDPVEDMAFVQVNPIQESGDEIAIDAPAEVTRGTSFHVEATVDGEGVGPSHVELRIRTDDGMVAYGQVTPTFGQGYADGATTVEFQVDQIHVESGEYTLVVESGGMTATQPLHVTEAS